MYLEVKDAYEQYLIYIENRMKIQSIKDLKEKFENKILPYWKNYNIYDIKELDYMKWQNDIEKFDYSNNYKSNLHYLMSGFLTYCVTYHELKYNVAKKVGNFKMKNVKVKRDFYTFWEFRKFIKKVNDNIINLYFKTLYLYGARPGEGMAFRFSDLDTNRILHVNHTISEHSINGKRVMDTPKTLESVRSWKIGKRMYKDFMKLKEFYIKKYGMENYDYFIFGGIKPLAPTTINRHKKKACEEAGIRPIELRAFRRSNASLLYHFNIPIQIIKQRLGHANINTTMKFYVQVYENKEKRVTRTLNLIRLLF